MVKKIDESNILLRTIIEGMKNMKAINIISLNLKDIETAICKYFIICTGTSNTHVQAIEGSIKRKVSKDLEEKPWHIEGFSSAEWILMDYSDVVVHVFQKEIREFYKLEEFWGDAKFTNYNEQEKNEIKRVNG